MQRLTRRTFTISTYREDEWWMIRIHELDGLTNTKVYDDIELMAREYIAVCLDVPMDSFDLRREQPFDS